MYLEFLGGVPVKKTPCVLLEVLWYYPGKKYFNPPLTQPHQGQWDLIEWSQLCHTLNKTRIKLLVPYIDMKALTSPVVSLNECIYLLATKLLQWDQLKIGKLSIWIFVRKWTCTFSFPEIYTKEDVRRWTCTFFFSRNLSISKGGLRDFFQL